MPAQSLSSTGLQDIQQSATVSIPQSGAVTLLDSQNNPASSVVVLGGRYSINTVSGLITFTPDQGFVGQAPPAQIQVLDRFGQETLSSYAATVTQTPPPVAPTLSSDSFSATVGSQLFGNVATNDTIPQNAAVSVISQSLSGTLVLAVDGSFNYTPQAGFTGDEFFTYSVCHPAPNSSVCSTALAQLTFSVSQPSQSVAAPAPQTPEPSRPAKPIPNPDPIVIPTPVEATAQGLPIATSVADKPDELTSCLVNDSGDCGGRVVTPGVGSFESSPDNHVIFEPNAEFVGKAVVERRWTRGGDVVAVEFLEFQVAPPTRIVSTNISSDQRAELAAGSAVAASRCFVLRADSPCDTKLEIAGVGTWKISSAGLITFAPVKTFIGKARAWLRSSSGGANKFVEFSVVVTPAKSRPPVRLVLSGFVDGSPILTSNFRAQIRAFMTRYSDYSVIRCSGQTEGPTVLTGDRRLATQRAKNACAYAMSQSRSQLRRIASGVKNHRIESPQLRRAIIELSDQ